MQAVWEADPAIRARVFQTHHHLSLILSLCLLTQPHLQRSETFSKQVVNLHYNYLALLEEKSTKPRTAKTKHIISLGYREVLKN